LRFEASALTTDAYYTIRRTEASLRIALSDISSKIALPAPMADYRTLQRALRDKMTVKYSVGVDGETSFLEIHICPSSIETHLIIRKTMFILAYSFCFPLSPPLLLQPRRAFVVASASATYPSQRGNAAA
jgi:hypothetical protein